MFSLPKIESTEIIIDENPDIYIRRAEDLLIKGFWFDSLQQCNIAIKIANDTYKNRSHYIFECAKILFKLHKYKECTLLLEKELENFRKDFDQEKYLKATKQLSKAKNMINFQSISVKNDEVIIKYLGAEYIKSVRVIGDFTDWDTNPIKLKKDGNDWTVKLNSLKVGLYNYKFVINDNETLDAHNSLIIKNNDIINNLFIITRPADVSGEKKSISEKENYIGQLKNGKEHGIGIQFGHNENGYYHVYGDFIEGELNGLAASYYEYANATVEMYGNFVNSEQVDGIITIFAKEYNTYLIQMGNFKENELDGNAISTLSDGVKWKFTQGQFINGKANGRCKVDFYSEGSIYEGEMMNDMLHGSGFQSFNLGQKYEGQFSNGEFNGEGTFSWQNGDRFTGEFNNGKIGGYGKYFKSHSGEYIGQVKSTGNNSLVFHGNGVFNFINGDKYEGEINNQVMHGKGKYSYANGKVLAGKFHQGEFKGTGSGGCYLTTAMCDILGKDDDCYELESLRFFRDNILLKTKAGKDIVDEYYIVAPEISSKLRSHINRTRIALYMRDMYICRILTLIDQCKFEDAVLCYKEMVSYVDDAVSIDVTDVPVSNVPYQAPFSRFEVKQI